MKNKLNIQFRIEIWRIIILLSNTFLYVREKFVSCKIFEGEYFLDL